MSFIPPTSHWSPPLVINSPPTSAPTISSPTSPPKSASSDKERRPKLRASCDACAASKVKCSKAHPICARCSANGSQCIYGISRKHGKPGRTRKRNPDGTPFIKASKQRPSPDGSEFGKFRIRSEPTLQPLPELETASNWSSNWSPAPSLPGTPEFRFEMTPEPFYMNFPHMASMDDILLSATQLEPEPMQPMQPELKFRTAHARRQPVRASLQDLHPLKDYVGGDIVNPLEYTQPNTAMVEPSIPSSTSLSSPHSPLSFSMDRHNPLRTSVSMPTSYCCYPLAYSTLESLRVIGADNPQNCPLVDPKSLDSVLSITKLAVQSLLQLLSCKCSSDSHLAILYSSITSKILTWYQIAAGVNASAASAVRTSPSLSSSSFSSSPTSSTYSSPLATPSNEEMTFNTKVQPLRFGLYEFDEGQQQRLRRQVVLHELKKCGQLVDALAQWRGQTVSDQAEFLYDALGAWLKSELHKTVTQVESLDSM